MAFEQKQQSNDLMIKGEKCIFGRSPNDPKKTRIQFYLTPEEAANMAEELNRISASNGELGVKIDFYVAERTNSQNGRQFHSGFCFVKPKQERQGDFGGGGGGYGRQAPAPARPAAKVTASSRFSDEEADEVPVKKVKKHKKIV
ncbi:MAG: hypothetical protein NVS9B9_08610 [Ktedonobacteraceae bacterium]